MDAPERPRPVLTIVVAVGLVVLGALAFAVLGGGEDAPLKPPDRIGELQRTPSEEVSTRLDMIATYTQGARVVVFTVSRPTAAAAHEGEKPGCVSDAGGRQCRWVDGPFVYTLVDNSTDPEFTISLAPQAQSAFLAANHH